jgi:hypothetical protein
MCLFSWLLYVLSKAAKTKPIRGNFDKIHKKIHRSPHTGLLAAKTTPTIKMPQTSNTVFLHLQGLLCVPEPPLSNAGELLTKRATDIPPKLSN